MRVVITGGAGFIGANLAGCLTRQPWVESVTVVDDLSSGDSANLADLPVHFLGGSILDPALLDVALSGADAVVHLAAVPSVARSIDDPMRTHHANATGTLELLQAVRRAGVPHVVVASSSSVYGANPQLPKDEGLRPVPMSPYAVSKLATETYALSFAQCYQLGVLAFRFFNVFGPLQPAGHAYAAVIPAFIDAALRNEPLPLDGDGSQTRDFTYVGTVTSVIADALYRQVTSPEPVNLALGTRTSLCQLIDLLQSAVGHPLSVTNRPTRLGDVRHSQADGSALRALFSNVEPVPLDVGLRATVAWFRSRRTESTALR